MSWAAMRDRMNKTIMRTLADGTADYLSRTGEVLAKDLPVIVESGVERVSEISGAVDRVRTHCVQKHLLQPLDLKGGFVMDGKTWHIDGIAEDDGSLITFYVVP